MENYHSGFKLIHTPNTLEFCLLGDWNKQTLPNIIKELTSFCVSQRNIHIDFSQLNKCDASAMIYLISLIKKFELMHQVTLKNMEKFEALYTLYFNYYTPVPKNNPEKSYSHWLKNIGIQTVSIYIATLRVMNFIGEVIYFLFVSLFRFKSIRLKTMLNHIETSAVNALFIIGVTSFLVGVVIAYQGSVQLEKFGANIFIVEMVSITMFREIAPLMTAIVIAGRTASSYTAEIGAMKITEEIDAMKTMGFEPTIFLTLPRVFALIISLPLLIFFSDLVSVFAGSVVAYLDLNITFAEFYNRMKDTVELRHFLIGIFKGIFFGIAIAMIGCYRGFQVQNNTTSIGKYTTMSVVNAIFIVIALNAIFSVILTQSGL
jgi:phospholipid/cholesterol/gamma-HCH transport system permease protein